MAKNLAMMAPVCCQCRRFDASSLIREQGRGLDAAQPIHSLRTITEIRDNSPASERPNPSVLGVFALVALTLWSELGGA